MQLCFHGGDEISSAFGNGSGKGAAYEQRRKDAVVYGIAGN